MKTIYEKTKVEEFDLYEKATTIRNNWLLEGKKRGDLVKASFNDEKIALAYVLAASALSLTLSIDPTVSCIETLPPENRMNFPIQYDPTVAILQIENRQWNQQDLFEMDLKDLKNLIKKG
ncbi:hypothetical protein C815_01660 [Firmicutes bacterium M10-2]|nr:hypothetical protein C815_01660 [Firmicutes bacterium M10-2]